MFGIACVCTSLIALVASIARQARGSYTMEERRRWMGLVLAMGGLAFVLGLILLFTLRGEAISFVGFVLIGLALICWSISSKVILLAKIWHADLPLANRTRPDGFRSHLLHALLHRLDPRKRREQEIAPLQGHKKSHLPRVAFLIAFIVTWVRTGGKPPSARP